MKIIKYIFLLIFWPKRLKFWVVEEAKAEGNIKSEDRSRFSHLENNIDSIRKGLLYSLLLVVGTIFVGVIFGKIGYYYLGYLSTTWYGILQYTGVGIILWATLAVQGWKIKTLGSHSLPERINVWVYRTLYIIGSFLLVLSVCWPTN